MSKTNKNKLVSYHHLPGEVTSGPSSLSVTSKLPSRTDTESSSPEHVPDELDRLVPLPAVPVQRDSLLDEAEAGSQPDAVHLPQQRRDVGHVPAGSDEALDPTAGDGGHELHSPAVDAVGAAEPVEDLERAVGVAPLLREVDEHELQLPRGQRGQRRRAVGGGGRLALEVLDGGGEEPLGGRGEGRERGRGAGVEAQGARGAWGGGGGRDAAGGGAGGLREGDRGGGGVGGERHGWVSVGGGPARVGRRAWRRGGFGGLGAW
jgi:hypothetical protein